jgi:hypothetical protein
VFEPDDLDAGFAELDRRFLALLAATDPECASVWSTVCRSYDVFNRRDSEAQWSLFGDDYRFVDHRVGSFGTLDAAGTAALTEAIVDVEPDVWARVIAVDGITPSGALILVHGSEGAFESMTWQVAAISGDRAQRTDNFAADQYHDALARFAELERDTPEIPSNKCTELFERMHDLYHAQDWDAYAPILTDDVTYEDRRPVVRNTLHGRTAYVALMRGLGESGVTNLDDVLVATRGDRLALYRTTTHGRHSYSYEVTVLGIYECDDAGRLRSFTVFDADDLPVAMTDLDGRYLGVG